MDRPDDAYRVETPERIDLEYDVAGLGSRFIGALVDSIVVIAILIALLLVVPSGLGALMGALEGTLGVELGETGASWAVALTVLLAFATIGGYFVFFELVWHGQSPGKKLVGLRVIKEGGYPIGLVDSAIRNVVRLVDFLPTNYIVGIVVMFVDGRGRRLGDMAAGTLVVRERRDLRVDTLVTDLTPALAAAHPGVAHGVGSVESPIPNLSRLSPAEHSLLREYFLRRDSLTEPATTAIAARLAAAFATKIDYDLATEAPDAFLARLASQIGRRS